MEYISLTDQELRDVVRGNRVKGFVQAARKKATGFVKVDFFRVSGGEAVVDFSLYVAIASLEERLEKALDCRLRFQGCGFPSEMKEVLPIKDIRRQRADETGYPDWVSRYLCSLG